MEKEVNTYGQFNFQIALEKIETLTQQNNELLDIVDKLEEQLHHQDSNISYGLKEPQNNKSKRISDDADAAMKRFTTKLRKELNKNGKSKQSKGQPV
jgi:CHASE3 domain sensor protein